MIKIKKSSQKKLAAMVIVICILVITAVPNYLSAGICEKALAKCVISVAFPSLIAIFLAPATAASGGAACLMGYSWCLAYYLPVN